MSKAKSAVSASKQDQALQAAVTEAEKILDAVGVSTCWDGEENPLTLYTNIGVDEDGVYFLTDGDEDWD